jgi:hypothetical protein
VPLGTLRPDLSETLVTIVETLLAKRPDERYATAGDVVHAVEAAALSLAGGAARGASPLAWDGDLDQWGAADAASATTAFVTGAGVQGPAGGLAPRPHARTQAMRAATTRLQMALEDDRAAARSTRRFWGLVAVATVAAAGVGFVMGRQRWRRPEPPWRRNRG